MDLIISLLKGYIIFIVLLMSVYTIRHLVFTFNRLRGEQRLFYQDIIDSDLPKITALVPMHNEEAVAANCLESLLAADYPRDKMEIMPVNDHSTDKTRQIVDAFAEKYPTIKPIHRDSGKRGKPAALNEAIAKASGDFIIVFDADYIPPKRIIKDISTSFLDPEVGAVMGRVIPINAGKNLLTRFLDLERSGGYQVDQQARHNLRLIPQYGGTVGGFRKDAFMQVGGFDPDVLTEDTELTYRLFLNGWRVVYANRAECYEEAPESGAVRARQIQRWAYGHCQCMYRYFWPLMRSQYMDGFEKLDGALLLFIYAVPFLLLMGLLASLTLFFLGQMNILESVLVFLFVAAYSAFGNFAPFYQIIGATILDGASKRMLLTPYLIGNFIFNMWHISNGFLDATLDLFTKRTREWQKTARFRKAGDDDEI